jgi:endonuclease YncB( thermonuclease family)
MLLAAMLGVCAISQAIGALQQESTKQTSQKPTVENQGKEAKEESIVATVTKVIDGDSLKAKTKEGKEYEIQVEGIDAPELKQPHGKEATEALSKMVMGKEIKVTWTKKDNFDRLLAQIHVDKTHANQEMLRTGHAWHFKRYNQSKELAELEEEAKKAKRGLWATENPQAPWDFRKETRSPEKPDR